MELKDESDIVVAECGQFVGGKGRDEYVIKPQFPFVRSVQCTDDVEQGTFTGSAGTDDSNYFFFVDTEVDAF